jgi:hypothetical protein
MEQESLEYTIIPFVEPVSKGPIRTFVDCSNIDTKTKIKLKYYFTKEELSMSIIEVQIRMKHASNEKKLAYKLARRRFKNCMSSQRYREKRKKKNIFVTNTLNDDSIFDQDEQIEQDEEEQDDQDKQIELIEQDEEEEQEEHEIIEDVPDLLYCIYVPGLIHYTYIPYIPYIPYITYI